MAFIYVLLFSASTPLVAYLIWKASVLHSNYRQARSIGLPMLITPADYLNPVWLLLQRFIVPVARRLPFGLGAWHVYSDYGFAFQLKYSLRAQHGSAFVIVNPGQNIIMVSDALAVDNLTSRRKDFQKSEAMYKPLEMFGPNVDTVEGEAWQRHRRLTTPPFNERNSALVWRESLLQATDMLETWAKMSEGVTSTVDDATLLALHVITSAGFGKSYHFSQGLSRESLEDDMTYRDALRLILASLFTTIIANSISIPDWLATKTLNDTKKAIKAFKKYLVEMVEEERSAIQNKSIESDNLMSVLIRASETSEKSRNGLSDAEVFGNLFIYSFAGHETTANMLAYATMLLSANPAYQDWLHEEIERVFGATDDVTQWQYEQAFPRLKRCLAVMYETLRLYPPVFFIPKYTNESAQILTINGQDHLIPPHTYVYVDSMALHTTPDYWGTDSLTWKPTRWITTTPPPTITSFPSAMPTTKSNDNKDDDKHESETLMEPKHGTFVPWASGPRVCPGRKFSQVEFTAVMARLFRNHRVSPVREQGETEAEAAARVLRVVEDSGLEVTLRMKHPERVRLRWEER